MSSPTSSQFYWNQVDEDVCVEYVRLEEENNARIQNEVKSQHKEEILPESSQFYWNQVDEEICIEYVRMEEENEARMQNEEKSTEKEKILPEKYYNAVVKSVMEVYKGFGFTSAQIDSMDDLVRIRKEYFLPLFDRCQHLFSQLREDDTKLNLFSPKLFGNDKELFNLSLIATVILTHPTLRSVLENEVDWHKLTNVDNDYEINVTNVVE